MKCETCGGTMKKNFREKVDNIKQCVECYWLIAFTNGNEFAEKKLTRGEIFEKVIEIAKDYPEYKVVQS